ncbi:hypothetical protein, partial [Streptomyces sp. SP17KL33]|uniref:hypothetical protein n=1 Tax=Streptomyces sp. SP17KL33 TaxID=3002534 RepID=UPI002E79FEC3
VDEQNPSRPRYPEILAELVRRVEDSKLDIRLAAHWGARMGLVEVGGVANSRTTPSSSSSGTGTAAAVARTQSGCGLLGDPGQFGWVQLFQDVRDGCARCRCREGSKWGAE